MYFQDCIGSKQMDLQCSSYCYDVVKPLLQHANQFYQKEQQFAELEVSLAELRISDKKNLEIIGGKDEELATERKLVASYESQLASKNAELKKLHEQEFAFKKLEQSLSELKGNNKALREQIEERDKKLAALSEVIATQKAQLASIPKNREEMSIQFELPSCSTQGIENFKLNLVKYFPVSCDAKLVGPGWIVIQRRMDADENFNRSWEDYRLGFGHLAGSFFLGLEKLHMLTTSRPHELYIYLRDSEDEVRYAQYNNFVIGDASEQYKLKSLTYLNGTAGDALAAHLGMKFTTYDKDNDLSAFNCGKEFFSGWWFTSCLTR